MAEITGVDYVNDVNNKVKKELDKLKGKIYDKIDDQSEGIAYGQKALESNIITSTQNKIDESNRIIKDDINAVYSKVDQTANSIENLENYVQTTQKQKLDDIDTGLGELQRTVDMQTNDVTHAIDNMAEGIAQGQAGVIDKIDTELKISSEMLKGEISEHDRTVIERFENISGLIGDSGRQLNTSINRLGDETNEHIKTAAIGINNNTDSVMSNATAQIESKIVEVEKQRDQDNWGIFEGVKQWLEGLFTIDPDQLAKTLMSMGDVTTKVTSMMKSSGKE